MKNGEAPARALQLTPLAHWLLSRCGGPVKVKAERPVCGNEYIEMVCLDELGHDGPCVRTGEQ